MLFTVGALASGPAGRVLQVRVGGVSGKYTFTTTVLSPDKGCGQYADWWEVVSPDGRRLLYRRILLHSHANEQPFTRSGGPVPIAPDAEVVVRVHIHPLGYARTALKGSVTSGFKTVTLPAGFGARLEEAKPKPASCWF